VSGLELHCCAGPARLASLPLTHATVTTPLFMPVATRGMVRLLPSAVVEELGYEVLLANAYHLWLRPGASVIEALGGLRGFTGFGGAFLTDSGGFQIMSLGAKVDEEGASVRNVYDGALVRLTPELMVEVQAALGADIAMVLDVCTALPADPELLARHMALTTRWAARARAHHRSATQLLFGIVQGGASAALRRRSARELVDLGFDGYGIGGLAVGEPPEATLEALSEVIALLPPTAPRYLMGVGDPYLLAHAIALGVDMADCVAPTRLARHAVALTGGGRLRLRQRRHATEDGPIEEGCDCSTCQHVPRALITHLCHVDPPSAGALVTAHNLRFQLRLIERLRTAIANDTLKDVLDWADATYGPHPKDRPPGD
jgi:queuine tRNA-ribosyltransferase